MSKSKVRGNIDRIVKSKLARRVHVGGDVIEHTGVPVDRGVRADGYRFDLALKLLNTLNKLIDLVGCANCRK